MTGSEKVARVWQIFRVFQLRTIRSRLIAAFILVVLLTAIMIAGTSALLDLQNGQSQVIDQLKSVAALKEDAVNTWLEDLKVELTSIHLQQDVFSFFSQVLPGMLLPAQRDRVITELQKDFAEQISSGLFTEIFLINSQGQTVFSSDPIQVGKIHNSEAYFQEGLKGVYVQPPRFFATQGKMTMILAYPIAEESGPTLGVIAGRVNLERLSKIMLQRAGLGETGETYLVAANQVLLTAPRFEEYVPGGTYIRTEGVNAVLKSRGSSSGLYDDYRGIPVVGVTHWLPQLQVVLVAEQGQTEAFTPVYRDLGISTGVSLIGVLLTVMVGLFTTRQIVIPLANLVESTQQIAAGNFDLTVPVERQDEIGDLAQAFNNMTARLRGLISSLEEHTRSLQTSAEISRQISTMLDLDELLYYLVNCIQHEFDFYHVHIYLVEEESGDLVMREGSGEVGQQLKERGHRLSAGQGIVGTVASLNEHFLSNNVNEVLNFVRNPLLPETNSELAVPLRKGGQVLGVLDIQSEQLNRFTQEDVSLIQSIADQTAVALDNTRLLSETQVAFKEVERLNRQLTRETWQQFGEEVTTSGYRFLARSRKRVAPDSDAWLPPMRRAALEKQLVKQTHPGNGDPAKAELAVPLLLRGQVIGVLGVKREETPDWAEEEVAAVEAVANQVALALENARLSKEQEKTIVQLKDIDRLKSEFLTSMSHELRTPLNSIIGFADVLLQGIDGELNDLAMNDIQLIHNSGKHLLALINDILDLSKIEAGKMELVREAVDINDVANAVLASSHSLVKDKPVEIIADVSDMLPPVYADKLRLNQILLNLVSNAAKFTHEGTITIKASLNPYKLGVMTILVVDTGIGIPANKLGTIFERFRQADSSTTRKYGGTGLGLAICKQLVEMHGGTLNVRSEEGVGSEFYFTIPLA